VTRSRALLLLGVAALAAATVAWRAGVFRTAHGGFHVEPDPIEFGERIWGDVVDLPVRLVNDTDRTVTLKSDPAVDCACFHLVSPLLTSRIGPGESLSLVLRMETQKAPPDRISKTFRVVSDDAKHPTLDVPVHGEVLGYRSIEPRTTHFGDVAADGPAQERRVQVRGREGTTVRVLEAVSQDVAHFTVALEPHEKGADLLVRTVPGAPKGRAVQAQILLKIETKATRGGQTRTFPEAIWVHGAFK
jgi:hypothetical protein